MEQYKNFGVTSLAANINSSATSLTASDGAIFPSLGNFRIRIDNEIILCTSRSGNILTIVRASGAVSHSSGVNIYHIITKDSFKEFRKDSYNYGSASSRDLIGNNKLQICPDDFSGQIGSFHGILPFNQFKPFDLSGFSWYNQGGASYDLSRGYLHIEAPPSTTDIHRGLQKLAPSAPYRATMYLQQASYPENFLAAGLELFESGTGKCETLHHIHSTNPLVEQNKWTNRTTYNNTRAVLNMLAGFSNPHWLQVIVNGGNISWQCSWDGQVWYELSVNSITNFFTTGPDYIAIFLNAVSTTNTVFANVLHWDVGWP